jgi:hypothetical protein
LGILAQQGDTSLQLIKKVESEIIKINKIAFYSRKESERIEANKKLIESWNKIIHLPAVLTYDFDSLKKDISILNSGDGKFKLISWNTFRDEGTHHFFGYLIVNNTKRIKTGLFKRKTLVEFESYPLIDKSNTIKSAENYTGTADKWYGMLYYQIIKCNDFYTLLGYDPNDKITQRKFIDVLYFKLDGTPVFGKDVFKFPRKNPRRLMFEYGSSVTMSLRYDENNQRIIYSHLAAKEEGNMLEGQFQFYGPDGSFDALVMKKDKWITVEDIDARNDLNKNDNLYNNPKKPNKRKNKKVMPTKK